MDKIIKDNSLIYINSCLTCKWYITARTCLAYPKRIPKDIWEGKDNHKRSKIGDHGYIYKKRT